MLSKAQTISFYLNHTLKPSLTSHSNPFIDLQIKPISSLKVVWRKDRELDRAIDNDKRYKICSRVVKEVLNEPGQVIPLRYLQKRRERMRLNVNIKTTMTESNPKPNRSRSSEFRTGSKSFSKKREGFMMNMNLG